MGIVVLLVLVGGGLWAYEAAGERLDLGEDGKNLVAWIIGAAVLAALVAAALAWPDDGQSGGPCPYHDVECDTP